MSARDRQAGRQAERLVGARAAIHAALGEPSRLTIVDELAVSDRSVAEVGERLGVPSNLLAHHLDVLEKAGVVERLGSHGDRRRRYVRLRPDALALAGIHFSAPPARDAVFVCTHNSARSQLAAALWRARTGHRSASAGTRPAGDVHPKAIAAGRRFGLDLGTARPRALTDRMLDASLVVTVCDRAHEELEPRDGWLHWSVPDPVARGRARDFDDVVHQLERRIAPFTETLITTRRTEP